MRLPTVNQIKMQMYLLGDQYDMVNRLQTQVSTGKKLISSSDDPFLANKIKSTESYLSELKSYEYNLVLAESMNNTKDTLAKQSLDLVQGVQQLLIQSGNETLSDLDRFAIADQLDGILTQFLSLANTTDDTGEYIFSGMNANTKPFLYQNGQYIYQGSHETKQIRIAADFQVNYTESGYHIFSNIFNGNGSLSASSDTKNNTGTGVILDYAITDPAHYVRDEYKINFVTNSQGELAYVITGLASGQVVPQPPLNSPGDAPIFKTDETINCNGFSYTISGQPKVGDTFSVTSSKQQNIFTTVNDLIQALKTPVSSETDRANLKQKLMNIGLGLEQANMHFQSYQTEIGNNGSNIDSQKLISENLIVGEKLILSRLSDADMPTLLSDLTRQLTIVQLTQDTYLKVQESFYNILSKYS